MGNLSFGTGKSLYRRQKVTSICILLITIGLIFGTTLSVAGANLSGSGTTIRIPVISGGAQPNNNSGASSLSADGRYIAFESDATNLGSNDTNAATDAFVYDRVAGTTEMVSVNSDGVQENYWAASPQISADGRFVAFSSNSTNLVPGFPNAYDIYVHDRQTGATVRASVNSIGSQGNGDSGAPSISANGRYVAFDSMAKNMDMNDTNATWDIYIRDLVGLQTIRASVNTGGQGGNGMSIRPCISGNGRFVAFWSQATNLVANDTNADWDVFVRDLQSGTTERVNVASDGTQAEGQTVVGRMPTISDDGRYIAFVSKASNLVANDTNGAADVFVHDRQSGKTLRVSVDSKRMQANADSAEPRISGNGRFIVFQSKANNLTSGVTNGAMNVFVHDLLTGQTVLASVASDETEGNGDSNMPAISTDGKYITFRSFSNNLVSDDTNGSWDIFLHQMEFLTRNYIPMVKK